jgi:hypothetical protein
MDGQLLDKFICEDARESSITPEYVLYRSQEYNLRDGEGISFTITTEVTANRLEYFLNPIYTGKAAKAVLKANGYDWHDARFQRILVFRLNTSTGKTTWFNQSHPLFQLCYISRTTKQPLRPLLFFSVVKDAVVHFSRFQAKITADSPVLPDVEALVMGIDKPSIHNARPSSHRRHQQRQADLYTARKQQSRIAKVSVR